MTATPTPPPPPASGAFPMDLRIADELEIANWRPLAHWLLAIPHIMISHVLGFVGSVVGLISWFAILFTGSLPSGLAEVQCLVLRYRTRAFAYLLGLTEEYPPFTFETTGADPGVYPIQLDIGPELVDRNRVTVFFRFFLLIPLEIVGFLYGIAVYVVGIVAWFAVLFTGRYPAGLRKTMVGGFQYFTRVGVYSNLLSDTYPSFSLGKA